MTKKINEKKDNFKKSPENKVIQKLERLCKCDKFQQENKMNSFEETSLLDTSEENTNFVNDEINLDVEVEYQKLIKILDLSEMTTLLTKVETYLPRNLKYGVRTGAVHMRMHKFSPLARGLQGSAISIAAIATSFLIKPYCWNEFVIDQVVDDGNFYFEDSYKQLKVEDRRNLKIIDLKSNLLIQKTFYVSVKIDEPICAGTFRSESIKDLHISQALKLFFQKYDAGVLTSNILNIAIWRKEKYFYIFDGQARLDNSEIISFDSEKGSAKLFFVPTLAGVAFIILDKCKVKNESFVFYGTTVLNIQNLSEFSKISRKKFGEPQHRLDGYKIQEVFRAVFQGSNHLYHPVLPRKLQGQSHLIIAVATIVYSKLLSSNKWSKVIIDLLFNQANIYFLTVLQLLGKRLDGDLVLKIDEIVSDVILGVYKAKIRVEINVVPGIDSKEKLTLDMALRKFFASKVSGIIEIKNCFYAVWREQTKYYILDPFSCNHDGFRIFDNDSNMSHNSNNGAACVIMNSSIEQLTEIILVNTESTSKDSFIIHGLNVLYIKTGTQADGSDDKVIFRAKNVNRRPQQIIVEHDNETLSCDIDKQVSKSEHLILTKNDEMVQFPEVMDDINLFLETCDETKSFKENNNFNLNDKTEDSAFIFLNSHKLVIRSNFNIVLELFKKESRGKQGLFVAIGALGLKMKLKPDSWTNYDMDMIIRDGHFAYEKHVEWLNIESLNNNNKDILKESDQRSCSLKNSNLDLSTLPEKLSIGNLDLNVVLKIKIVEGNANPLSNLSEALENYFTENDEMIFENKNSIYPVWKSDSKFFILNPYGADQEGYKNNACTAALFVIDSINGLVDLMYNLLETSSTWFFFHAIGVSLISTEDEVPRDIKTFEMSYKKYEIKFLPVSIDSSNKDKEISNETDSTVHKIEKKSNNAEGLLTSAGTISQKTLRTESIEKKQSNCVFAEFNEPDFIDTPSVLNLSIITGLIKINLVVEDIIDNVSDENYKINNDAHSVSSIHPNEKLCKILYSKLALKSVCSLLSRFSIDSNLPAKAYEYDDLDENDNSNPVKSSQTLINLPKKKYIILKNLPNKTIPVRAIDNIFIKEFNIKLDDENKCNDETKAINKYLSSDNYLLKENSIPKIIPLGPCIKCPIIKRLESSCKKKIKKCQLTCKDENDNVFRRLICSTENLLLQLLLPDFQENNDQSICSKNCEIIENPEESKDSHETECCGFQKTDFPSIGIIRAHRNLRDRLSIDENHYKSCYYAAVLCILVKININSNKICSTIIDSIIEASQKITESSKKLKITMFQKFRNINILNIKYNIIIKQIRYADPGNHEPDRLKVVLKTFFKSYQTGILSFNNISYGFWKIYHSYYLFDPYTCDENGSATEEEGGACLLQICDYRTFIDIIINNSGKNIIKPYRLYSVEIANIEKNKEKKKNSHKRICKATKQEISEELCNSNKCPCEVKCLSSLIESKDWINQDSLKIESSESGLSLFMPIKNYKASAIEVEVLENDVTRPSHFLFKTGTEIKTQPYDRKYYGNSLIDEPLDIFLMAWAQIYEPTTWSIKTIKGIYRAGQEYAVNCNLATEDSTINRCPDCILNEFNIANYIFRVVFAPLHNATLYSKEDWNLAKSIQKVFDASINTGAIVVCAGVHIGTMKIKEKMYAWWFVKRTKKLRIVTSEETEDFLKLIVKELDQPEEVDFTIRVITITWAKLIGPNCSNLEGLHDSMLPSTAIAQVHRKHTLGYDVNAVFRSTSKSKTPMYIQGNAALKERDKVEEPKVKRCYFVALFAVVLKRDIIQNLLPTMIDKVLDLGERSYKMFEEPKFHTEHIIKDVSLLDRVFNLRDCTFEVQILLSDEQNVKDKFYSLVRKRLKEFFKRHTSGIIQFSNCCYGFWYSNVTGCFYYLDPYPCSPDGKRVESGGSSCLCIFSSICAMIHRMCLNQFEFTTGFYLHRVHVELVNVLFQAKFQEDPVWLYLDYHWSYKQNDEQKICKCKTKKNMQKRRQPSKKAKWKNYFIEIPNLIYSIWGTIGAFDKKLSCSGFLNQAAIAVSFIMLRDLYHPSEWNSIILDFGVITGEEYFHKSKRCPTHKNNDFLLAEFFEILIFKWKILFLSSVCGVLYGSSNSNELNLSDGLSFAFTKAPNMIIQCEEKIITVLKTANSFYAVDSSWVGPPLFIKDHGAAYAIRCKNINNLVYVMTKMINTNQKLKYKLTPVRTIFSQTKCQSLDGISKKNKISVLKKTVYVSPAKVINYKHSLVCGDDAVADEDSYFCYTRNLKLGLKNGKKYEAVNASLPTYNKTDKKKESTESYFCEKKSSESIYSLMDNNMGYHRVFNLLKNVTEIQAPKLFGWEKRKFDVETSFIDETSRNLFYKYNMKTSMTKNQRSQESKDTFMNASNSLFEWEDDEESPNFT